MKLTSIRNPFPSNGQSAAPIVPLAAPTRVILPLLTPWGIMKPLVGEGERVVKGQTVARADDARSPAVHASVSGTVRGIQTCTTHDGKQAQAVVSEADAGDAAPDGAAAGAISEESKVLAEQVAASGIAEVDSYAWPVAARLASPELAADVLDLTDAPFIEPIELLIINGLERQPGDRLRQAVIQAYPELVAVGVQAALKMSNASEVIFAHSSPLPPSLLGLLDETGAELRTCPNKYPLSLEPLLVQFITGREVPQPEGDPRRIGVAVIDVVTASRIGRAVTGAGSDTDTLVQLSVPSQEVSKFARIPVGTPLEYVLQQLNGSLPETAKVVIGGLCLGYAQHDLQVPLTQQTDSIVLQTESELTRYENRACINCGHCVRVCPMNLMPNELGKFCEYGKFDAADGQFLFHCIERGVCSYVCPARRPMVQFMRYGKQELAEMRNES